MRPAEPREVVHQRIGQVARLAKLPYSYCTIALREAFPVGADNHRQVRVGWRGGPEGGKDVELARGIVDVIIPSNNVRDRHLHIVYHHRKVVGRHAIGARDHQIVQLLVVEHQLAGDEILDHDLPIGRILEPHHRVDPVPCASAPFAAVSVVAGLFAARALALAHLVQALTGAIAMVGVACVEQLPDPGSIVARAFRLKHRTLVPVEPQPPQSVQDRVDRFSGGAFSISVFDAQHETPPVATSE